MPRAEAAPVTMQILSARSIAAFPLDYRSLIAVGDLLGRPCSTLERPFFSARIVLHAYLLATNRTNE
jgi:hypothetical protein